MSEKNIIIFWNLFRKYILHEGKIQIAGGNKLNVKSSVGWRLKYFCQPLLVDLAGLVGVGITKPAAKAQLVENKYFDYKL